MKNANQAANSPTDDASAPLNVILEKMLPTSTSKNEVDRLAVQLAELIDSKVTAAIGEERERSRTEHEEMARVERQLRADLAAANRSLDGLRVPQEVVAYRYGTALLWPDDAPVGEPDCDPLVAPLEGAILRD